MLQLVWALSTLHYMGAVTKLSLLLRLCQSAHPFTPLCTRTILVAPRLKVSLFQFRSSELLYTITMLSKFSSVLWSEQSCMHSLLFRHGIYRESECCRCWSLVSWAKADEGALQFLRWLSKAQCNWIRLGEYQEQSVWRETSPCQWSSEQACVCTDIQETVHHRTLQQFCLWYVSFTSKKKPECIKVMLSAN